jgi:glyceraldehyde-3-phosphate dehydrogenase/erythrose-4-phosphate dehydrogenase
MAVSAATSCALSTKAAKSKTSRSWRSTTSGNAESNAHLTRYDTAHGKFPGTVTVEGDNMIVNGDKIRVFAQRNPAEIPWGELGVDVVLECTGFFTTKEKASAHLKGGAKKVIISAPGGKDVDATIVFGVNQDVLKSPTPSSRTPPAPPTAWRRWSSR